MYGSTECKKAATARDDARQVTENGCASLDDELKAMRNRLKPVRPPASPSNDSAKQRQSEATDDGREINRARPGFPVTPKTQVSTKNTGEHKLLNFISPSRGSKEY